MDRPFARAAQHGSELGPSDHTPEQTTQQPTQLVAPVTRSVPGGRLTTPPIPVAGACSVIKDDGMDGTDGVAEHG
jgi:hypothetical protein